MLSDWTLQRFRTCVQTHDEGCLAETPAHYGIACVAGDDRGKAPPQSRQDIWGPTFEVSTLAMLTFAGGPVGSGGGAGAAGGAGDTGCCCAAAPAGWLPGMNALAAPPAPSPDAKAGGLVGAAVGTNAAGAAFCAAICRIEGGDARWLLTGGRR